MVQHTYTFPQAPADWLELIQRQPIDDDSEEQRYTLTVEDTINLRLGSYLNTRWKATDGRLTLTVDVNESAASQLEALLSRRYSATLIESTKR
jgi:hypothetical protein